MTAVHARTEQDPVSFQFNMEDSSVDREERKREYNRLAQREFRRRRKEHLKSLEQAQREQNSEQAGEIERLRHQNAELKRENEALKAQMYGSPMPSHQYQMPATLPSSHQQLRSYSMSPSLSSTLESLSNTGSPPAGLPQDIIQSMPLGMSSSMLPSSMHAYAEMSGSMGTLPAQQFPMVQQPGVRDCQSKSSLTYSGPSQSRQPSMGSEFQSMSLNDSGSHLRQQNPGARSDLINITPFPLVRARATILQLFQPLLSNPNALSNPTAHISTLQSLAPTLPPSLKPTKSQLGNPHFYGIDLLSSPTLRDRLIGVGSDLAEQFVTEVFGHFFRKHDDGSEEFSGITIWGEDPLNEMSWEVSEHVLGRWGWLLGRDWVERTNFWRRQRGVGGLPDW